MTYFDAVILGVIQGVTEFIPVSSDGHLALAENLGIVGTVPFFFTVCVHLGTLIATLIFFRTTIWQLILKAFSHDGRVIALILALVVGTIPAGIVGIVLNDSIDAISSSLVVTGVGFVLSAVWLVGIEKISTTHKKLEDVTIKDAVLIGLLQITALLPGASRSGSTIFGGKLRKIHAEDAFVFSFLLSVPAIFGALLLQIVDAQVAVVSHSIVGAVVSGVVGYYALRVLKNLVIHNRLLPLAGYCFVLGILSIVVWLF